MAEFPMMPFWGNDFFGDGNVMPMMGEDIGAYVSLMWYAWQHDGMIPNDPEVLQCISRSRQQDWMRIWGKLKPCWHPTADGKHLVNNRVLDELFKVKKMVDDRSKAGKASVKARGYRQMKRRTDVPTGVEQVSEQVIEHTGSGSISDSGSTGGSPEGGGNKPDPAVSPTMTEFRDYFATLAVLPAEADDLFHLCEQRGWKDGGEVPITDWRAFCRRRAKYVIQDRNLSKGNPHGNNRTAKNAGLSPASRPTGHGVTDYTGVGQVL